MPFRFICISVLSLMPLMLQPGVYAFKELRCRSLRCRNLRCRFVVACHYDDSNFLEDKARHSEIQMRTQNVGGEGDDALLTTTSLGGNEKVKQVDCSVRMQKSIWHRVATLQSISIYGCICCYMHTNSRMAYWDVILRMCTSSSGTALGTHHFQSLRESCATPKVTC